MRWGLRHWYCTPADAIYRPMSEMLRRLFVLVLGLALVAGPLMQAAQGSGMALKMAAAAPSALSAPAGCEGCGDDQPGVPAACLAICTAGISAVLPPIPVMADAAATPVSPRPAGGSAGSPAPPDPYPPKPLILS